MAQQQTSGDDARVRADKNAEEARRIRLAVRAVLTGLIFVYVAFVILGVLIIVFRSTNHMSVAESLGGAIVALIFVGLVGTVAGGPAILGWRDKLLALEAEGRRLRAEKVRVDSRPDNLRQARLLYRANLPRLIDQYRLKARRLSRVHSALQVLVIVGSLSASTLIATVSRTAYGPLLATANTLIVGLAATLASFFKLKDKSLAAQTVANRIEEESQAADLGLNDYAALNHDAALAQLITRVEDHRREHRNRELQLDEAPEARPVEMSAPRSQAQ